MLPARVACDVHGGEHAEGRHRDRRETPAALDDRGDARACDREQRGEQRVEVAPLVRHDRRRHEEEEDERERREEHRRGAAPARDCARHERDAELRLRDEQQVHDAERLVGPAQDPGLVRRLDVEGERREEAVVREAPCEVDRVRHEPREERRAREHAP